MKLYIYRLEGCKTCLKRQPQHNKLASYLSQLNIEVQGVLFGMVNGERIDPLPEHDRLCRKDDDPMKYQAPVYIFETDDAAVKLPDLGKYNSIEEYVNAMIAIVQQATSEETT